MSTLDPVQVRLLIGTNQIQTGPAYDWSLTHITGHTFMEAEIVIGKFEDRDGGYEKKRRYEPREITMYIQSKLGGEEQIRLTWLQLRSYLNAHLPVTLEIFDLGRTLFGDGILKSAEKRDENSKWNQRADIKVVVLLPDPWLKSAAVVKPFQAEIPLFMFPFTILAEGFTTGVLSNGNDISFEVGGSKEAPFKLTLTMTGDVVNPKVTDANGQFIKALGSFVSGDVLVMSTKDDQPGLRLNGAIQKRDRGSTFFKLPVGWNTLTVTADSGVDNMTKSVSFWENWQ